MSTTDRGTHLAMPWLVEGERLDRATFHERYAAMPEEIRVELIGGLVVYMPSRVSIDHGQSHADLIYWLGEYHSATPGTQALPRASLFLDDYGEHHPDVVLRILPENGGRTQNYGDFYGKGPELVVEVSDADLELELGPKFADYERAGVEEYLVVGTDPPIFRWHNRWDGRLVEVDADADGIYRSKVFPGLWLDPAALLNDELRRLREVVELGVATADHAAFVRRLAQAGGADRG